MANYKTETTTTQRTFSVEFTFLGNQNGVKVEKADPKYGDGLIITGKGGKIYVTVRALWYQVTQTVYRLRIMYSVSEDGYTNNSSADCLQFVAYKDLDISAFYPVNNTSTVTESWQFSLDKQHDEEAYYRCWFHGTDKKRWGWLDFDIDDYPDNHELTWFPASSLQVKLSDKGNDLNDVGNIGVKGITYLKVTAVKTTRTKLEDSSPSFTEGGTATQGAANSVLNLDNEYDVKDVLGYGYDMCSEYAVKEYLKVPVLNLDRLNKDLHIIKIVPIASHQFKKEVNGYDEYTKEMSSSLKVEVKGSLFGMTFSNTTERTEDSKLTEKNVHKLVTALWSHQKAIYRIDETNPALLRPYVTDNFKSGVSRLCSYYGKAGWDDELNYFMQKYGTHVLTGMIAGGRVDLNMSYKQTTTKASDAKTFSTASAVGFSDTGELKKPDGGGGKGSVDIKDVEKLLVDADGFEDLRKGVKKLLEKATGSPQGGEGGNAPIKGNSVNISAAYNMKEILESATNEEISDFNIIMRGGNLMVNPFIDDNATFNKWRDTLDQKYTVWCDYDPGRIIPIYKFAPDNYSMNILEKAWTTYCVNNGVIGAVVEYNSISSPMTITGDTTCVKSLGKDANVETSDQWPTGWKLNMNLVNLSSTNQIALAVRYQVVEGHKAQNGLTEEQLKGPGVFNYDDNSCTNLILERVIPLSLSNAAVDSTKVVDHLEVSGVKKGDQTNLWIDVTNDVRTAIENLLTNAERRLGKRAMVEIDYPFKFKIRLEGAGDDQNYLGLDFQLYVPYLKFNS